ncbi:uncharacterized protein LOC124458348 [Xenia sp. Carnegie-2017]|uniref:uncharacterized protein LOC124458348 n=1 Tax=Xenia sp. Carnegie-2017 TaxID=2897299 RepID=UPI001F04CCC3|nr:uncharacterized protein LOC124458348 [Xenia sp. Carnegie-2017]
MYLIGGNQNAKVYDGKGFFLKIYRHKLNMLSCVIPELDEGNICPTCPKTDGVTLSLLMLYLLEILQVVAVFSFSGKIPFCSVFQNCGYALDPSDDTAHIEEKFVGDVEKAKDSKGLTVFEATKQPAGNKRTME